MVRRGGIMAITLISLISLDGRAMAQDAQLPTITVTASPIHRRAPAKPAPAARPAPEADPALQAAPDPFLYRGTLPIVTDQFATVTVMPRDEIDRATGLTLGEILQN